MENQQILDGSLWEEFCDRLKAAGQVVLRADTPSDAFNRAMGYRYLTRLLRCGLESTIDYADPQFPDFFRLADETKKIGNDNPDFYYQNCVLDGRFDYRIYGHRGTVTWLSFGCKGGNYNDDAGMVDTGYIDSGEMSFNDDGSFELFVSATPKEGNWLKMSPNTRLMVVRQIFGDRQGEEIAQLSIECQNPQRENNNLDVDTFPTQLLGTVAFVENTANLFIDWMSIYRDQHLNRLPEDDQVRCRNAGGDANIHYYQSYWKLAPDEALVVHLQDIPDCESWNLQLSNYWCESMDYRFFPASVNKQTVACEEDGSVIIVIAHDDPGPDYPNWLNTCRHDQGGMLGRYIRATDPPAEMPCQLVEFSALASLKPQLLNQV